MTRLAYLLPALGFLAATGCITAPKAQKSDILTPTGWQISASSTTTVSTSTGTAVEQAWWDHFQDPTLTALLLEALKNNKSLALARARVQEARAARGVARAALFPQISGRADASRENLGVTTFNETFSEAEIGLDASWEIDLFGHNQALSAQAQALLQSEEANEQGVIVSLLAEVARTYFDFRNDERQIDITTKNLEYQKQTLNLINVQVQGALASDFDVQRAAAQVSTTESEIPALQINRDAAINRLNVLLGYPPGTKDATLAAAPAMAPVDPSILMAAPATVLANRPDVRAADRQLAATLSGRRAAISNFFPRITLLGFYGVQASNLFSGVTPWSIGGNLVQPLLNFGLLRSQYNIANARQSEAFYQYQETVLEALENMNNALSSFLHEYDRNHSLNAAVAQDKKSADLAQMQFTDGDTDLLDVLVAQRNELDAESALATSDTALRKNLVSIYTAAGGGWQSAPAKEAEAK